MLMRCVPRATLSTAAAPTLKAPPASETAMIQVRVLKGIDSLGKARIIRWPARESGIYRPPYKYVCLWCQPDQAGHAAGHAITAVGKEIS